MTRAASRPPSAVVKRISPAFAAAYSGEAYGAAPSAALEATLTTAPGCRRPRRSSSPSRKSWVSSIGERRSRSRVRDQTAASAAGYCSPGDHDPALLTSSVGAAEVAGPRGQEPDVVLVGQVALVRPAADPGPLDQRDRLLGGIQVAVGDQDGGAAARERDGQLTAQPAASAGDEGQGVAQLDRLSAGRRRAGP